MQADEGWIQSPEARVGPANSPRSGWRMRRLHSIMSHPLSCSTPMMQCRLPALPYQDLMDRELLQPG